MISGKTQYFVEAEYWKNFHNKNKKDAEIKKKQVQVNSDLLKIGNHILEAFYKENENNINKEWLKNQLYLFYNPKCIDAKSDLLVDAIEDIINNARTRRNALGGIGLSKSRINSYKSLNRIIKEYQDKRLFKVKDVDLGFSKSFLGYLIDKKGYQESYAIKKLADLKTVCFDAQSNGIEVSYQLKKIHSAKKTNENIIYLNESELRKIDEVDLPSKSLDNARKWLLLGCNIGQRASDLLNLDESNFVVRGELHVIELKQQKTGKNITIPILTKTQEVLNSGLPYKISIQKFNENVKQVCKLAGIDEVIYGGLIQSFNEEKGKSNNRKVLGNYHKWQLISSHVCRRSFATNLYGELPTPLIMSITGHSSEKMLLNYIGKKGLDYAQQIADFYALQENRASKQK
ncbi:tyrosine-type recombinase/integrase [Winogradskyella sp.]|uniref:tyrosine-type recombinase/integrase n=1 Tax=Winogradskyella sp. TaxID=1883156 RepID=UPI0026331312|nr:tyrosine-type recombinase/integrase [Winogradskyella sp.]